MARSLFSLADGGDTLIAAGACGGHGSGPYVLSTVFWY
jgi:hypothetical protein